MPILDHTLVFSLLIRAFSCSSQAMTSLRIWYAVKFKLLMFLCLISFPSSLSSLPCDRSRPPMAPRSSMLSFFLKFAVGVSLAHHPVQYFPLVYPFHFCHPFFLLLFYYYFISILLFYC